MRLGPGGLANQKEWRRPDKSMGKPIVPDLFRIGEQPVWRGGGRPEAVVDDKGGNIWQKKKVLAPADIFTQNPGPDLWLLPPEEYEFDEPEPCQVGAWSGTEEIGEYDNLCRPEPSRFYRVRGLLSAEEVQKVIECAVRSNQYICKPGAIGRMASFEYNVMIEGVWADLDMEQALSVALDSRILPYVRERCGCPTGAAASVLVRRYVPGERRSHELHFDSEAVATAVVGLSDPSEFKGGLFIQPGPKADERAHAPLEPGDVLVHSWDLQHGVHVLEGIRYSLVIFFYGLPGGRGQRPDSVAGAAGKEGRPPCHAPARPEA